MYYMIVLLLQQELYEAFNPHGYLLTMAVPAVKEYIDDGYEVAGIAQWVVGLSFVNGVY